MERDIKHEMEKLKIALQNEIDSSCFYKDIEKKFSNTFTKKTFGFLAKQKLAHIDKIKEFDKELTLHPLDMEVEKQFNTDAVEEEAKEFFDVNMGEYKVTSYEPEELESYKLALEIETVTYRFYKTAAEKTIDYNLKKLFTYLMREEQIHHSLLQVSLKFLHDPKNYLPDDEDWLFEG